MPKKLTTQDFIEKAKKIHNNKYDYSKVKYVNNHTLISIVCPIHGEFTQLPMVHLRGCECSLCGNSRTSKKLKKEKNKIIVDKEKILKQKREKLRNDFIEKAKKIHGNKFNYSKVDYINNHTKVCIIDEDGEEFWQLPSTHLKAKDSPKHRYELIRQKLALSNETFIKRAKEIHGDKYDYSKIEYVNNRTKVCIICPEHGEFYITPDKHLMGEGCVKCSYILRGNNQSLGKNEFIKRSKLVHGDKYDYSKVEYRNTSTKVCIICPEHGEFWQPPVVHLKGNGCNLCHCNKMETEILSILDKNDIKYIHQKEFDWLKNKKPLRLDFYLPDYNIAIECQGEQHFQSVKYFGGDEKFKKSLERDILKKDLCEKHGIKVYYYTNLNIKDKNIFTNIIELIETIKSEKEKNELK